jgi:hypothetical protein
MRLDRFSAHGHMNMKTTKQQKRNFYMDIARLRGLVHLSGRCPSSCFLMAGHDSKQHYQHHNFSRRLEADGNNINL